MKRWMQGGGDRGDLVQINQGAIRGEPGTGYESPKDLGEFECENCKFFGENDGHDDNGCDQEDMKKKSKRKRLPDGRVDVENEGCCEYVWRIGRKDDDEKGGSDEFME